MAPGCIDDGGDTLMMLSGVLVELRVAMGRAREEGDVGNWWVSCRIYSGFNYK